LTLLPEVEVIRKDLEKEVSGKRFKDVTVQVASMVGRHRNRPDFVKALEDRRIESVSRRGIYLLFALDDGNTLVVHLSSQARLTRETANAGAAEDVQFLAVFTTGGALHLHDPAKSSELFVVASSQLDSIAELSTGGIDPLADTFTWPAFAGELKTRRTGLKKLFCDQSFILGLGDLYSDEILWTAGLVGTRVSNTLTSQEVRRLYRAIFEVLYEAVKQGGTSSTELEGQHTDLFGEKGDYGEQVRVFQMEGRPCPRCRRPVARTRIDTHLYNFHCSSCQT
jgi:formamidopyrimidine-DNA glycosylase